MTGSKISNNKKKNKLEHLRPDHTRIEINTPIQTVPLFDYKLNLLHLVWPSFDLYRILFSFSAFGHRIYWRYLAFSPAETPRCQRYLDLRRSFLRQFEHPLETFPYCVSLHDANLLANNVKEKYKSNTI